MTITSHYNNGDITLEAFSSTGKRMKLAARNDKPNMTIIDNEKPRKSLCAASTCYKMCYNNYT